MSFATLILATSLLVEVPLYHPPQQHNAGGIAPTWDQSVQLSVAEIELAHWAIYKSTATLPEFWQIFIRIGGVIAFDVASYLFPGGGAWSHEEGHRSVMASAGIRSRNGVNDFRFSSFVAVYGMSDDQITSVKQRDPPHWVRVQAAGYESELILGLRVERDAFLYDQPRFMNFGFLLFSRISVFQYWQACASGVFTVDALNEIEGPDVGELERDFTGPDCNGFVYDLHRPNEPYAARGLHPTGVGLRRARFLTDMTRAERKYVRTQRSLTLLNFVDPQLFTFTGFDIKDARVNASLMHVPTSFGHTVDVNFFFKRDTTALHATFHNFQNRSKWYPGVTFEVLRSPINAAGRPLFVTTVIGLWLQPENQEFRTRATTPGLRMGLKIAAPIRGPLEAFGSIGVKSAGWVALHPSLAPRFDGSIGLGLRL